MDDSEPETLQRPPLPDVARYRWTALLAGAIGGAFSALLGVGGGVLLIPMAILLLRIDRRYVTGTTMAVILMAAVTGALRYRQVGLEQHEPVWTAAGVVWLAVGEIGGALIGARLAPLFQGGWPKRIMGGVMVLVGIGMMLTLRAPAAVAPNVSAPLPLLGIGALAGVVSGALTMGGELALIPALALLLAYPQRLAQGTSLAVIVIASISGLLLHVLSGTVAWGFVLWLGVGAVVGAWLTAGAGFSISQDVLRALFSVFLMFTGVNRVTLASLVPQAPAEQAPENEV